MSQLHSLLSTCDEKERAILAALPLRGKEKDVFILVSEHAGKPLPENKVILKLTGISETHLYKINSVLVRKCYDAIEPAGGIRLLEWLKKKNLYVQLRNELGVQEKPMKHVAQEEREAFYLACYRLLLDVPFRYYDKKLTESFGRKYLEVKKGKTLSDELFVKFQGIFADLNRAAAQKNPLKKAGIRIEQLRSFEKELTSKRHYLALYYLYRSFCSYYSYYEKDSTKVLEYLDKAMKLKEQIQPFFPIAIGTFLNLLYADALFSANRISEAFERYKQIFSGTVKDDMYGYHYHCEQYVLLSVIVGQYDRALELLRKVFDPCIEQRHDIYATRGALSYAKLYISTGDHKKALHYINIAREINEKTFYLPFDLQIRVLENLCFYFKKDDDFAHQLTVRNLKFLHSQKMDQVLNDYILLFRIIAAFIKCREEGKALPPRFTADHERISKQYMNLYCDLLSDMGKVK